MVLLSERVWYPDFVITLPLDMFAVFAVRGIRSTSDEKFSHLHTERFYYSQTIPPRTFVTTLYRSYSMLTLRRELPPRYQCLW